MATRKLDVACVVAGAALAIAAHHLWDRLVERLFDGFVLNLDAPPPLAFRADDDKAPDDEGDFADDGVAVDDRVDDAPSGPAKAAQPGEFRVEALAASDAAGRAFVVQGYVDVIAAEGKVARPEEVKRVESDLDAVLRTAAAAGRADNARGGGVLLCRSGPETLGYLWYVDVPDGRCPYGPGVYAPKPEHYVWVHTVYTAPAHRRRGVARALYAALDTHTTRGAGHGAALGPAALWLDVYDNNPGSAALHRGLGFEPVTTVYRKALG